MIVILTMKTPIEYIKEAWVIYTKKENFIFFARIMAVLVILGAVISFINSYFYPVDYIKNIDYSDYIRVGGFLLISIIAFLLSIWSQSTTYMTIFNMGKNEKTIFILGYKNMWRFFLISLVYGLIVTFGILLLVIPAVIFGIWYSFSIFLVLDKKMNIGESLSKSKIMVKDKFFKILGRYIIFGLFGVIISVVVSVIPYIGTLIISFMAPLFILPGVLLYRDLSTDSRFNDLGTV